MKVLYLTYGPQSGVVKSLAGNLLDDGHSVESYNVASKFNYRYNNLKLPRISMFNLINFFQARKIYKNNWRQCYRSTDYAIKKMSIEAERIIRKSIDHDLIMQSGVLFSPSIQCLSKKYVLGILDNTLLIGQYGKRRPMGVKMSDYYLKREAEAYNNADKIFVMSDHVKNSLTNDYSISENKIVVTGVGPNVEPIHDEVNYTKYQTKRILMIGMNFQDKGGYELLSAYERVKKSIPGAKLIVIGDSTKIQMQGVEFRGILQYSDIVDEFKKASVFVMPSHKEAFGIAFIEAMGFKTACIGTDIEAVPEIIEDGVTGFVVGPGNIDLLAEKITTILNNWELSMELGVNGYMKYLSNYQWKTVMNKIYKGIESI